MSTKYTLTNLHRIELCSDSQQYIVHVGPEDIARYNRFSLNVDNNLLEITTLTEMAYNKTSLP